MRKPTADSELRLLRVASAIPQPVWVPLAHLASVALAARPPSPLRQWQRNATIASGRAQRYRDRRAAQYSWLRNNLISVQLGRWSRQRIIATVRLDADRLQMLRQLHTGRGLVLALPHMGSWDWAGAFACVSGLPVTSVAERLPAGQFEYFSRLRAELGFEIYPYDQPNLVSTLAADVRRGRTICLVADRDFGGRGLPVRWPTPVGEWELTLPAGPALIASQTGAALVGITTRFVGRDLVITIGDEIVPRPGRDGVVEMAQELADFFATQIAAHPTDWHMMQRFFPGEVV